MNFTSGSRVSVVKEGKELLCARKEQKTIETREEPMKENKSIQINHCNLNRYKADF